MLPIIFTWGPFTLYSFGLMLFLGFVLGLFMVWKKAREEHFEEEDVLDALLISSFWALVGARIMYLVMHPAQFGLNVLDWVNILGKPGFAMLGGLIGGVIALSFQTRRRKWDFYEFCDFTVTGLSLTMVFGWFGAFLNGSAFGLPTESLVGVRFLGMFDKRHPTQLYAMFLFILLFIFLVWVEGKYRTFEWYRAGKSGVRSGFLTFSFTIFLGLIGLVLALFSPPFLRVGDVSLDALVWSLWVLTGIVGLYWRSGREWSKDVRVISGGKRKERVEMRKARRKGERLQVESDIL